MTDLMVIVSAAVFDKARDAKGRPLREGSVYPTALYASSSKAIASRLSGDLYLVTVKNKALWLVGILRAPRRTKAKGSEGWAAVANTTPIVDITPLVTRLKFDTGTGIKPGKIAMSLQTPRTLIESDVALLQAAAAGSQKKYAEPATAQMAESAVVAVTARLLGRSEAAVRADRGRYAAFHEDDSFADQHAERINWRVCAFKGGADDDVAEDVFGRSDFDLPRSLWSADVFEKPTDRSLRPLLERQEQQLYGAQLAALVNEKRIDAADFADATVMARLQGGTSLVEAMTSLLMLREVDAHQLVPGEFAKVHRDWTSFVATLPAPLRASIGVFFQDEQAARCTGACFEGKAEDRVGFTGAYETLLSWWIGEGQGSCHLVRIVDDTIADVPAFAGQALLRKPASPHILSSGRSDEVTAVSPSVHLRSLAAKHPLRVMLAGDVHAAIAAQKKKDPRLLQLFAAVDPLVDREEFAVVLAVVTACLPSVREKDLLMWEYLRAVSLTGLGCYREALASAELGLALFRKHGKIDVAESINRGRLHNQIAWVAYLVGDFDVARDHAERAVAADKFNSNAEATLAVVLFACGAKKKALKMLEQCMKEGIDPCPNAALAADPSYRALAMKYAIPVELSDAEARELT